MTIKNKKRRTWLTNLRVERNLSQAEIADFVNVTQQMYGYVESGKRNPSPRLAKKIAKVLDFDWTKFYD